MNSRTRRRYEYHLPCTNHLGCASATRTEVDRTPPDPHPNEEIILTDQRLVRFLKNLLSTLSTPPCPSRILAGSFSCGNAGHDGDLRGGTGVPGKRLTWPWKRKAAQSFHDCPLKDGHQAPYVARAGNRNHRLDVGRTFARKRVAEKSPAGRGVRATYKI